MELVLTVTDDEELPCSINSKIAIPQGNLPRHGMLRACFEPQAAIDVDTAVIRLRVPDKRTFSVAGSELFSQHSVLESERAS